MPRLTNPPRLVSIRRRPSLHGVASPTRAPDGARVAKPDALPRPDALPMPADSDERPRDHPAVRVIADNNRTRTTNCIVGDHQRPPLLKEKGGGSKRKPPPQLLQTTDTDEIEAQRMNEGAGQVGKGVGATVSAGQRPGGGGHGERGDRRCSNPHRCLPPPGTGALTSVTRHRPPFAAMPPLRDANHLAGVCLITVGDSRWAGCYKGYAKPPRWPSITFTVLVRSTFNELKYYFLHHEEGISSN